jgi:hypothetical protein
VHGIEKLARDCPGVNLALSLHAPTQETRITIVPSASAFKIDRIMDALDRYSREAGGRQIMIEYILIDGVNADENSAHALGALLASRRAYTMVNLIPYNRTDIGDLQNFRSPSESQCETFMHIVSSYRRQKDGFSPDDCASLRGRKGGSLWTPKKQRQQFNSDGSESLNDPEDSGADSERNVDHVTKNQKKRMIKKGARVGAQLLCTVRWSTTRGRDIDGACGQLIVETAIKGKTLGSRPSSNAAGVLQGPQLKDLCRVDVEDLCGENDIGGGLIQQRVSKTTGAADSNSKKGRSEDTAVQICDEHVDNWNDIGSDSNFSFTPHHVILGVSFVALVAVIFRSVATR